MSLLDDLLERGASHLRAAGIENPRAEARLLLAYVLGLTKEELIAGQGTPNAQAMANFETVLHRRLAREPLAYIVGMREFWSLPFAVGPGVLIPRPDSETLVEAALALFPPTEARLNVLDLGTGSGCLLLAFLSERPPAKGIGVDISSDALAYAMHNAASLGLAGRCGFLEGHWGENVQGRFDVVFINPPYVRHDEIARLEPEIGHYEPAGALSGGTDGLDAYRAIAPSLAALLADEGRAFVEIGEGETQSVTGILERAGLKTAAENPDLSGRVRCLVVRRA
jgi:release factor glutamine methyltransferase